MRLRILWKASGLVLLSLFLTAGFAFAQQPSQIDRRATVQSAFENFLPILYFLSGSDRFLEQLTPLEKKQFELLGNYLVPHVIIYGPSARPGAYRTSNHINFKLKFSDRSEDFKLNPNEAERTAKVDTDVWFNLNIINRGSTEWTLLDAFQILVHEFGHKLGPEKDQAAIDQVASKMRRYLNSFYKEQVVVQGFKVASLLVPQVFIKESPIDMQPEPMMLLERPGQIVQLEIDATRLAFTAIGFRDGGADVQAYRRLTMTPKYSIYQNGLLIEWDLENKNILVGAQSFNYLNLFLHQEKAKPFIAFEPITERKHLYQLVPPQMLLNPQVSGPIKPQLYAENKHYYAPEANPKWAEKLKVASQISGRVQLETVIQMDKLPSEVALTATQSHGVYHFPGEIERLAGDFYKVRFTVPDSSWDVGSLIIDGIAIDGKTEWKMDESLKIPMKNIASTQPRTLIKLEIWNGSQWVLATEIAEAQIKTDKIKMRFYTQDTGVFMNHVMIDWLAFEDIVFQGKSQGLRNTRIQEIIPFSQLKQSRNNGNLIIEFESRKASKALPVDKSPLGMETKDANMKALEKIEFVDQRLQIFAQPTRLVQTGWKSMFEIVPARKGAPLCARVH